MGSGSWRIVFVLCCLQIIVLRHSRKVKLLSPLCGIPPLAFGSYDLIMAIFRSYIILLEASLCNMPVRWLRCRMLCASIDTRCSFDRVWCFVLLSTPWWVELLVVICMLWIAKPLLISHFETEIWNKNSFWHNHESHHIRSQWATYGTEFTLLRRTYYRKKISRTTPDRKSRTKSWYISKNTLLWAEL